MNQPQVHMCPSILKHRPHHHLPPHSIPLGCPRAPALSAWLHALNLNWSSVLYMVIYVEAFRPKVVFLYRAGVM